MSCNKVESHTIFAKSLEMIKHMAITSYFILLTWHTEGTAVSKKIMAFILRVTHYNRDVVEINRFNLHIITILKRQNML